MSAEITLPLMPAADALDADGFPLYRPETLVRLMREAQSMVSQRGLSAANALFALGWKHEGEQWIAPVATAAESDPVDSYLTEQLRMWKDEGVPAPLNELQSIHAWLGTLADHGAEETMNRMRSRMVLLMSAANALDAAGPEAVEKAGIYDNRPDMRPAAEGGV